MLDPRLQEYYYKVKQRKGFKTARRAVARKMLTIVWHMLTKEEPYRTSQIQSPFKDKKGKGTPCV